MPSKAQISEETRHEIIQLHGKKKAADVAADYGIKKNFVKQIWYRAAHPEHKIVTRHVRRKPEPQAPVLPDDDPIVDHGVTLMQLGDPHCRWPVGKDCDGAVRFCGCERYRSNVYEIRKQENTKSAPRFKSFYCLEHDIASLSVATPAQRAAAAINGRNSLRKFNPCIKEWNSGGPEITDDLHEAVA